MTSIHSSIIIFSLFCMAMVSCHAPSESLTASANSSYYTEWNSYLGDPGRSLYSSLDQINIGNVDQLEVAWTYHSGVQGTGDQYIQTNPLISNGLLFGVSPGLKVFAINAATGEKKWEFNPFEGTDKSSFTRGLAYWQRENDHRILFSADKYLYALNANTGELIEGFGTDGRINLTQGLGKDIDGLNYSYHAPGAIYDDLIIMGALNAERLPAAPGHIRAFDVLSGEQEWIFHTIPQPGEYGHDSWKDPTAYQFIGGANNWTGMTVDEQEGIVYVPTGSAAFDFYGGNRHGDNLFANSVLALDAKTGKRIWHFQTVHHDMWDRDLPAPPNLVTINKDGKEIQALAQITKSGFVFVFDRLTGEPVFPIIESPYPASDLIGEEASLTQPLPTAPPPFARQRFDTTDINPHTVDKDSLLMVLNKSKSDGQFIPPSTEGTVIFPGFDGGGEWGGASYDPTSGIMYVNANEMPWILTMVDVVSEGPQDMIAMGKSVYQANCMGCHGANLQGSNFHGNAPELTKVNERLSEDQLLSVLKQGRGSMPAFSFLPDKSLEAVTTYLLGKPVDDQLKVETIAVEQSATSVRYNHTGYNRFVDSEGYPAVKPPWGTLNAIDLNKGEILWKVPLGEYEALTDKGIPITGQENYGGPVVTAGGLIFIAATKDEYIRAFDKETGEEVWKYKLPAAGMATPATYEIDGRQYLVIAAGGGKITKKRGDAYVAFALPQE